jgi:hypothetical protein
MIKENVSEFARKTELIEYMYTDITQEIYHAINHMINHIIMEDKKFHDLPSANWRNREVCQ